jgi:hypothetical protein
MKALTLHQPWATLIMLGVKRCETRGWATSHRGPLAIHAAKAIPDYARDLFDDDEEFRAACERHGIEELDALPLGAVLGQVRLVDCRWTEEARRWADDDERLFGNWAAWEEGRDGRPHKRWAWQLAAPRAYARPIPARGAQGLWDWTPPGVGSW